MLTKTALKRIVPIKNIFNLDLGTRYHYITGEIKAIAVQKYTIESTIN